MFQPRQLQQGCKEGYQRLELVISGNCDRLIQMNFSLPKLYEQVKLHKANHSLRPIVTFYSDPTYKLAQYLAHPFPTAANFQPKYSVKNSLA